MSIDFAPRAKWDLEELVDDIQGRSGKFVAHRFSNKVARTLQLLERFPSSGELIEPGYPLLKGLRAMGVRQYPNHVIYFLPEVDGIRVVRVLYGPRDRDATFGS